MAELKRTYGRSGIKLPNVDNRIAKTPSAGFSGSKWLIGSLAILLLATAFLGWQLMSLRSNPNLQGQKELERIIKKVNQLVVLPEGEIPTLATVTDPEKLKDQAFFAHAKTGYKVLLYTQAQKAILYDPVSNRVVEIAPINPSAAPTTTPTDETPTDGTGGDLSP